MVKVTLSPRLRRFSRSTSRVRSKEATQHKEDPRLIEYSPTQRLLDETFIAQAIWECLKNNDPEGVVEMIEAHLEAVNKVKAAEHAELSRATMYNAFRGKNPTVKTLAKLVNCCV